MPQRIGFVGTRFHGTDGVSLESAKWAEVLWQSEHVSYWYGGKLDRAPDVSMLVPEAFFGSPEVLWIQSEVFGKLTRSREATRKIEEMAVHLTDTLYQFVDRFQLDLLVAENCLCLPVHIPLGVALTRFIAETGIPTIAHHHDFAWERTRFTNNAVADYLEACFPPKLPTIQHVTINSSAQRTLAHRKGISSGLVPNVLDFDKPPSDDPEYAADFRGELNLSDEDIIILQPTRVVPRKGIEQAIALADQLHDPRCKLVVTHAAGDEGLAYHEALVELAARRNVAVLFVADRIADRRGRDEQGRKLYSLWDAYHQADLIAYPSLFEGFGNALLEAFYCKKPVLVNRYSIFIEDIEPKQFKVITIDGFITNSIVEEVRRVLNDREYRTRIVEHNFNVARKFFNYTILRRRLRNMIAFALGMENDAH